MSERKVAVIGVHGVGEQVAGDTAAKIAQMLGQAGDGHYTGFTETALKIPVTTDGLGIRLREAAAAEPVVSQSKSRRARPLETFDSVFYKEHNEPNTNLTIVPTEPLSTDLAFTQTLLAGGEHYRSVYETTRWSGKKQTTPVDIYELYWSDLSHGGTSGNFAVFGQFVQLLVHLASLGRTTAATAIPYIKAQQTAQLPSWKKFYFWNSLSYWLLSMPIVIGNLWFILLGLEFTAAKLSAEATPGDASVVRGVLCGLTVALLAGWVFFKFLPNLRFPLRAFGTAVAGLAVGGGIGAVGWDIPISLLVLPLVWGIGEVLMRGYETMREGALVLWRRAGLAVLVVAAIFTGLAEHDATYRALLIAPQLETAPQSVSSMTLLESADRYQAYSQPPQDTTYQALLVVPQGGPFPPVGPIKLGDAQKRFHDIPPLTQDGIFLSGIFHAGEVLFVTLAFVWGVLCFSNLVIIVRGAMLARKDVRRAVHTCVAAALLPAPLFLGAALVAWSLFANYLSGWLSSVYIAPLCWSASLHPFPWAWPLQHIVSAAPDLRSVHDLLVDYINGSGWVLFLPYSETVLLVLILIVVGLTPSIFLEIFPLNSKGAARDVNKTESLGNWMDSAFTSIRIGAGMVLCAFLFVLGAGLGELLQWVGWSSGLAWNAKSLGSLNNLPSSLEAVGLGAGTAAAGFLAATKLFAGTLSDVFGKMRVAVDTLQDVDNWLRERPAGNTVRLHVFARYHSLLRYLAGKGYTEVLIVAHSQGTVVTADFLRHLKLGGGEFPEGASKWQIRLLTMGCPLRQLYNWRFPQLYDWVVPDGVASGPKPGELGVTKWVNAYGSGDYVGRHLWGGILPTFVPAVAPSVICGTPTAEQFCVGAQAHTFYLNPANATIAATIDGLI